MKKLLVFLLLGININAFAQYFDNFYESIKMGSGMTTRYVGDGHLLAGITSDDNLSVFYTDATGGFSVSNFKTKFHYKYNGHDAVINGSEALELKDSSGFVVIASFATSYSEYGLIYLKLNTSGSIVTTTCYTYSDYIFAKSICESTGSPGDVFVTGDATNQNKKIFAARYNTSGTQNWGYIYSTQYGWTPNGYPPPNPNTVNANDIVQSAYFDNVLNDYPLIVVGGIVNYGYLALTYDLNGLWLYIDPSTGMGLITTVYLTHYNDQRNDEEFKSIIADSLGYFVTGFSNYQQGINKYMLTYFDGSTASSFPVAFWNKTYASPYNGDCELNDLVYRPSNGTIYSIGKDDQGSNQSLVMMNFSTAGNLISGTEYSRGNAPNLQAVNIDINYYGTNDGLGLYDYGNNTVTPPYQLNIIKPNYNGTYSCSTNSYEPTSDTSSFISYDHSTFGEEFTESSIELNTTEELDYTVNCSSQNKARQKSSIKLKQQTINNTDPISIYPNPIAIHQDLTIQCNEKTGTVITIQVINTLGQVVSTQSPLLQDNGTLHVKTDNLAPSQIYMLQIIADGKVHTKSFMTK